MYRMLVVGACLALFGCTPAKESAVTRPAAQDPAIAAGVEAIRPTTTPQPDYPEKEEVESLLYSATQLESAGKHAEALEVVNRAVALDPISPRAAAFQKRLEDILRRT